jgi:predicted nucleotidyltransferase component of viral defense system
MTGGTALAAFYLEHRLSEDLDLFTSSEAAAARMRAELDAMVAAHGFAADIARSFPTFLEAATIRRSNRA